MQPPNISGLDQSRQRIQVELWRVYSSVLLTQFPDTFAAVMSMLQYVMSRAATVGLIKWLWSIYNNGLWNSHVGSCDVITVFQVVCVCVLLSGHVSVAELTCETLILLSTNLTGSFLSVFLCQGQFLMNSSKVVMLLCLSHSQQGWWHYSTIHGPSVTPQVCTFYCNSTSAVF